MFILLGLRITVGNGNYYDCHFTDEETKAQGDYVTCPRMLA